MLRRIVLAVSCVSLAVFLLACPKHDDANAAAPSPTATFAKGPTAVPGMTVAEEPTPRPADPNPAAGSETVIQYKWSGGLSMYQYYAMTIRGTDTAKVAFVVKPVKSEEKRVDDTLDAAQFAELKALFEKAGFDALQQKPRGVRILDIGQTVLSREGGGKARKEVFENGGSTVDGDMQPLRKWFDDRVRVYLDKSGARPK